MPKLIMDGTKILSMTVENLHFLDSLNFIPMALKNMPKSFDLTCKKGYYPHFFNTAENLDYVGAYPEPKYYGADFMSTEERTKFLAWHKEQKDLIFRNKEELLAYCMDDVNVLRQACCAFRNLFLKLVKMDPFRQAITISSICNKVFRTMFLKPDTVGLIPRSGYRLGDRQSAEALQWLVYLGRTRDDITHAGNGREAHLARLPNLKIDGFSAKTNEVFEYLGCFWHGCPCMPNRHKPIGDTNETLLNRYEETMARLQKIRNAGYKVVSIWGCEFKKLLSETPGLENELASHPSVKNTPINIRDALYGGRTEATKMWYKAKQGEEIHYADVISLYPTICKYGKFPLGHPRVYVGADCPTDCLAREGIIKCKVLPPRKLYHPVLPYKSNDKLMFPLCSACADTMHQGDCTHSDEERCIVGTWVVDEVCKAVEKGYVLVDVFEFWEYRVTRYSKSNNSGGLFAQYVNMFLKLKQESSGYPSWVQSEDDKDRYIEDYRRAEGITLDKASISKNSGQRTLAKLKLNSMWGKWAQNQNKTQTSLVSTEKEFYELLTSPGTEITNLIFPNDDVVWLSWKYTQDNIAVGKNVNVAVAAYVTTGARLKLYEYLEQLGESVLYCDTDSVIYIHTVGKTQKISTGDYLGDLTNELEEFGVGSYIEEFVSGGPKNYAFSVFCPSTGKRTTKCKVKGITLNYENSKIVNFTSLRKMILEDNTPVYVYNPRKIKRKHGAVVVSEPEGKQYKVVFKKRRLMHDFNSLPYGYI